MRLQGATLTEPDVNVSAHPAPIVQPFHPLASNAQTATAVFPLCGLTIALLFTGGLLGVCLSVSPIGLNDDIKRFCLLQSNPPVSGCFLSSS